MAMPVNMILVMYAILSEIHNIRNTSEIHNHGYVFLILCILSYDFKKLTMLYIHVHISIAMTNKSGLTFFLSIKYLSVCLSVIHT